MKMKKFLAVCLSAAMTMSLLSACGGAAAPAPAADAAAPAATEEAAPADEAEAPAAEEASGEVQEISFMIWDDLEASEDLITKGYKESVDRFNKDF